MNQDRGEGMNQDGRNGTPQELNLGQAITSYLSNLAVGNRESAAPELHRLMRWFGADRQLQSMGPSDLERYQQQLTDTGVDPTQRLGPVKDFLTYAKQKRLTPTNLATHVRVRRKTGPRTAAVGTRMRGETPEVEVTREGYAQLQRELERLEQELAPQVREELKSAYADKDFRENAPYDAAKQRLGEIQGKINELKAVLGAATIVTAPARTDRVTLGSVVTVRDLDDDEELTYTLVGPGEADPRKGRISTNSPVGKALAERTAGDTVEVVTPAGSMRYRIERIGE